MFTKPVDSVRIALFAHTTGSCTLPNPRMQSLRKFADFITSAFRLGHWEPGQLWVLNFPRNDICSIINIEGTFPLSWKFNHGRKHRFRQKKLFQFKKN